MPSPLPYWARSYVDATEPITINLRNEDVAPAVPNDGSACVAAHCLLRALGALEAYVYKTTAYALMDDGVPPQRWLIPRKMRRLVIDPLDDGRRQDVVPGKIGG